MTALPLPGEVGRFEPGASFDTDEAPPRSLTVRAVQQYRDRGLILHFDEIDDRTAAETVRGAWLTVDPSQRRVLEPGEFWPEDLVGLEAVTPAGALLGVVRSVVSGPQDRLVVGTADGREVEVPFVHDLVGDPQDGRIVIDPPAGLF